MVASNVTSIPEVAGVAGDPLVSPDDIASMTGAVARLLDSPGDRKKQAAAGKKQAALFSWKNAAEQTKRGFARGGGGVVDPRVTAVVLNWNNEHDTKACVDSLLAQDCPALKILIVDNGSPDGSGPRLHARYPNAEYLQTGRNLGYCGGNNRGIKQAVDTGADYVLVINNDTVLDSACVRELVCATDGEKIGAVGAKVLRYDAPDTVWFAGGKFDRMKAIGIHPGEESAGSRSARNADARG